MTRDTNDPSSARLYGAPAIDAVAALEASTAPVARHDVGGALNDALKFPRTLKTETDSPLLLGTLTGGAGSRFEFVRINGVPISTDEATPLPGIRVGHGDGSGFVFRRALDGELVFVPDSEFRGVTTFGYTIVDRQGAEATLIAMVIVQPDLVPDAAVECAHGSAFDTLEKSIDANFGALEVDFDNSADQMGVSGDGLDAFNSSGLAQDGAIAPSAVGHDCAATNNTSINVDWTGAQQGPTLNFIGMDDYFRFLEGVTEQQWDGFDEGDERGVSDDKLEVAQPLTLIDWLMPIDDVGPTEPSDVRPPSTGEPFSD